MRSGLPGYCPGGPLRLTSREPGVAPPTTGSDLSTLAPSRSGGTGRHAALRMPCLRAWGFKSPLRHCAIGRPMVRSSPGSGHGLRAHHRRAAHRPRDHRVRARPRPDARRLPAGRRAPKAVAVALVCELVVLPAVCFGLVDAFDLSPLLGIGMMLLVSSPGGTTANLFSHLFHGDVALHRRAVDRLVDGNRRAQTARWRSSLSWRCSTAPRSRCRPWSTRCWCSSSPAPTPPEGRSRATPCPGGRSRPSRRCRARRS